MLVLSVTDCPPALRGDLSHWLVEIDTGVYVGRVSQRVREEIWKRVTAHLKTGRAVLVFNARNEQKMDFRVHNAAWEPIGFDGIKLMLRPHPTHQGARESGSDPLKPGYSSAAKMRKAKHVAKANPSAKAMPERFVVIDLETTGLQPGTHEIIELGAIKVAQGLETACFQALIRPSHPLTKSIASLTGLSDICLAEDGQALGEALPQFISFLEDVPIVSHNILFDFDFLKQACAQADIPVPHNRRIDTLSMARRYVKGVKNHKLTTLMQHFSLPYSQAHRSLEDCRATLLLLNKLIEMRESSV